MSRKIEFNYLNLNNYPIIAKHFEKMAKKGWLINNIIGGVIFIYKKIEKQDLEFSITPYEVETSFTRKTKSDLKEFQTVSENVGWNYATKSFDLHIYFKEKGTKSIPLQTNDEEEFEILEPIVKRYLKTQYILLPILLLLAFFNAGNLFTPTFFKSLHLQIPILVLPLAIIGSIIHIFDLRKFLKKNRENIKLGKSLEYNNSKHFIYKTLFIVFYIIFIIIAIYTIYSAIILKNRLNLLVLLPISIGLIIGSLFRIFVKPSRKSIGFKITTFVITLIISVLIAIPASIIGFNIFIKDENIHDVNKLKVLTLSDFKSNSVNVENLIVKDISILAPQSYENFSYFKEERGYITTEYSDVLNEELAKHLVNIYIRNAKNSLLGRTSREIELSLKEGVYDSSLEYNGLTKEVFDTLKNKDYTEAEKLATEIIEKNSITKDSNLWNVDEAYYLNYEKSKMVIRNGKEVFYLEGLNFSDPEIIKITKNRLELN